MSKIIIGTIHNSGENIEFEPYIKKIDDSFKSDWNQQHVLGRMDPVATFQRTRRTINLSFDVPASTPEEAQGNRQKMKKLATFLYPAYQTIEGVKIKNISEQPDTANSTAAQEDAKDKNSSKKLATNKTRDVNIMASSPILYIKFANLICDPQNRPLYGFVDSFVINPYEDMGYFIGNTKDNETTEYWPKAYSVVLNFNVIHTQELGWNFKGARRAGPFSNLNAAPDFTNGFQK